MSVIYEPKGRALEYAPLACNLYTGCTHACRYCFAPAAMRTSPEQWHAQAKPRKDILHHLASDARRLKASGTARDKNILLCFTCDPYPMECSELTRDALCVFGQNGLSAQVLTKAGMRASRDFDVLARYGFKFGTSLMTTDDNVRRDWEPNAASVQERVAAIKAAHGAGIYTWVSVEPVVNAREALAVIESLHPWVTFWKIGKLNHMPEVERTIDWARFLGDVRASMNSVGKIEGANYYIKRDLAAYASPAVAQLQLSGERTGHR
jgi:DNA repair photolyase